MTPNEFRELALSFTEAIESAHMHHADFRVGGRIFATLGYPDQDSATVKLTREEQIQFVRENPGRFQTGQWRLGPARKHKHLSAGGQGPNCPRSAHRSVAQHRTETAMEKSLTQVTALRRRGPPSVERTLHHCCGCSLGSWPFRSAILR